MSKIKFALILTIGFFLGDYVCVKRANIALDKFDAQNELDFRNAKFDAFMRGLKYAGKNPVDEADAERVFQEAFPTEC